MNHCERRRGRLRWRIGAGVIVVVSASTAALSGPAASPLTAATHGDSRFVHHGSLAGRQRGRSGDTRHRRALPPEPHLPEQSDRPDAVRGALHRRHPGRHRQRRLQRGHRGAGHQAAHQHALVPMDAPRHRSPGHCQRMRAAPGPVARGAAHRPARQHLRVHAGARQLFELAERLQPRRPFLGHLQLHGYSRPGRDEPASLPDGKATVENAAGATTLHYQTTPTPGPGLEVGIPTFTEEYPYPGQVP